MFIFIMDFTATLYLHSLIGQVSCSSPNPLQWIAIVAMVGAAGVFTVSTGVGTIAVASTLVTLITTGASIAVIAAEISASAGTTVGLLEALSWLVVGINSILGC